MMLHTPLVSEALHFHHYTVALSCGAHAQFSQPFQRKVMSYIKSAPPFTPFRMHQKSEMHLRCRGVKGIQSLRDQGARKTMGVCQAVWDE